jgi:hypothetical protein
VTVAKIVMISKMVEVVNIVKNGKSIKNCQNYLKTDNCENLKNVQIMIKKIVNFGNSSDL